MEFFEIKEQYFMILPSLDKQTYESQKPFQELMKEKGAIIIENGEILDSIIAIIRKALEKL